MVIKWDIYIKNIIKKLVSKKFKFIINFSNIDIKNKNYFIITFLGSIPLIYVWSNFGQLIHYISNVEKINFSIFSDPKVYFSIILLAIISVISPIEKKILFKRKKK